MISITDRRDSRTSHDPLAGHHHEGCQGNTEGGTLSKAEQRKAGGGLEGCILVPDENLVILLCFISLIIKVLQMGEGRGTVLNLIFRPAHICERRFGVIHNLNGHKHTS